MGKLIVVSNRVMTPSMSKEAAGGLAVGLLDALRSQKGLWFGWDGTVRDEPPAETTDYEYLGIRCATTSLSRAEYSSYYCGFSNGVLWPTFHYRVDLSAYQPEDYAGYLSVNTRFARLLRHYVEPDDLIWVHDYHLLPFAQACRQQGIRNRIGFFLHTPFPAAPVLRTIPPHRELVEAMCAYDLVGFQTEGDARCFIGYLERYLQADVDDDGYARLGRHKVRIGHYPVGIDPHNVRALSRSRRRSKVIHTLKQGLEDRKLIISVDRLDYSKGIIERFNAFERLLETRPRMRGQVTFLQIAPTTRSDIEGYRQIRRQLETAAGRIHGKWSELTWTPLRYMNRSYERAMLFSFFRASHVGFVTPLRDGMNLVAKEYVAAQPEDDPGVLVLSEFAGAADELGCGALLVNPYDTDAMARALYQALTMPLDERLERHQAMMEQLEAHDIAHWRDSFVADLGAPVMEIRCRTNGKRAAVAAAFQPA